MQKPNITPNSVISLMAPTAAGKTALAYELYDTGRYELISVDSALIYRDMNIGTAKPTAQELQDYPHHIVDIIDPTQSYSVADFVQDVERLVTDIHNRDKIPLLVGGTMMYYMALFDGLSRIPDSDLAIRAKVEKWRQADGIEALYQYLHSVDKSTAKRLHSSDTQRITRAVEVYQQTGKPISEWQALPKQALAHNPQQNWIGLGVIPDRQWLHTRIKMRLETMWASGFVPEVLGLINKYHLTQTMPSMRCVDYRQVIDYLLTTDKIYVKNGFLQIKEGVSETFNPFAQKNQRKESVGVDEACQDMKNKALYATRQLAKRQTTWLRKLNKLACSDVENDKSLSILSINSIEKAKQLLI
ncbi:MAG: tRNA (adenosine(37)-N6)-dimethylallyltransferase MiaA [Gammaproteobacteria bacterium]|nr:MAG: tRNA (adenosine(37)-N6)-dimethylallyltransferase MiaA [Gammaproteobacteria bacterium]